MPQDLLNLIQCSTIIDQHARKIMARVVEPNLHTGLFLDTFKDFGNCCISLSGLKVDKTIVKVLSDYRLAVKYVQGASVSRHRVHP